LLQEAGDNINLTVGEVDYRSEENTLPVKKIVVLSYRYSNDIVGLR
jgi:hypothetical protein